MDTDDLAAVRALLDPLRLAVAGAVATEPLEVDDLVGRTGAARRAVLQAVADLRLAGLLDTDQGDDRLLLATGRLRELAASLTRPREPMDRTIGYGMTDREREVLARFFEGRRLVEIPANGDKRRIVLERLALEFEPGRRYREATVVDVLRRFHPDHAALRRHLVDAELLDRGDGMYWRAGGRVALDDDAGPRIADRTVRIRAFREHDRGGLIELWHAADVSRHWNDPGRDIDRKLDVDPDGLLVAAVDVDGVQRVVGSAMVGYEGHRGWVNYLAVDPVWRGTGIARRLVTTGEELLAGRGCPKVNVQVRTGNHAAIGFYERLGYTVDEVTGLGRRLVDD